MSQDEKQEEKWEWWQKLADERMELQEKCAAMEADLSEIRLYVRHLDEILEHLAPLAGVGPTASESLAGIGITDAIRSIFSNAKEERLSAGDIRRVLGERGFDLSGYTAVMATIYKVLSRLEDSGEIERVKEDGKVFFRKKEAGRTEITDDDIPF